MYTHSDKWVTIRVNQSFHVVDHMIYSVLQWVAMCCSELRCVAVSCSELLWVAVSCSELRCVAVSCSELQWVVAVSCSELQWVAVCCSELQCVAVSCSVLQCVAVPFHVVDHMRIYTRHEWLFARDPPRAMPHLHAPCLIYSYLDWFIRDMTHLHVTWPMHLYIYAWRDSFMRDMTHACVHYQVARFFAMRHYASFCVVRWPHTYTPSLFHTHTHTRTHT